MKSLICKFSEVIHRFEWILATYQDLLIDIVLRVPHVKDLFYPVVGRDNGAG